DHKGRYLSQDVEKIGFGEERVGDQRESDRHHDEEGRDAQHAAAVMGDQPGAVAERRVSGNRSQVRASLAPWVPAEIDRNFLPTMRLTISSMFVSPMSRSAALRPS